MPLYGVPTNDFEKLFYNQDQDAGFYRYLMNRGWGGVDPTSQFARRQQGRLYGQYSADAASNPNEGFYDYLSKNQPNLQDEFMQQSPAERGDLGSLRYAPRVRYVRMS